MNNIEALIELIEKGDAAEILAEKDLSESFNELLKYGLIDCNEGKILLTQKGQEAKIQGIGVVLQQLRQGDKGQHTLIQPAKIQIGRKFPVEVVLAVLLTFLSFASFLILYTLEIV